MDFIYLAILILSLKPSLQNPCDTGLTLKQSSRQLFTEFLRSPAKGKLIIGYGSFGEVAKVYTDPENYADSNNLTLSVYPKEGTVPAALKVFNKGSILSEKELRNEANVLNYLNYLNKRSDKEISPKFYGCGHNEKGEGFILMEALESSLFDIISKNCSIGMKDRLKLYIDLIRLLDVLHTKKLSHCDLKLDNIVASPKSSEPGSVAPSGSSLYTSMKYRLIDFGKTSYKSYCKPGTEGYAAPETLIAYNDKSKIDGRTSDVYSLGIMLWQIETECKIDIIQLSTLGSKKKKYLMNSKGP